MLTAAELELIEALPQPILCCQPNGLLLHVNTAARNLLNLEGMTLQPALTAVLTQAGLPPSRPFEWLLPLPNAAPLYLQVSPALLTDSSSSPRLLLLTLHDISEQKRAETAEQALRDLTRSLDLESVLKAILDNVGRIVPHDSANIMLIEGSAARCALSRGYPPDAANALRTLSYPLSLAHFQHMLNTGEAYLLPDVRQKCHNDQSEVRSYLAAPIRAYDRVIGFLNLESRQPNAFTPAHAERLRVFGNQAAIAVENAQLYEAMYHDASELRALNRATAFLFTLTPLGAGSVSDVAQRIASMIVGEFAALDCSVLLLNESDKTLEVIAHAGDVQVAKDTLDASDGLIGAAVRGNQTVYVPDVRLDPRYIPNVPRVRSELVVPLRTGNRLIGVINLQSEKVDAFSLEDHYLLEAFAPFAAAAIDNVRLYHRIQQYSETLEAIVAERTLEAQRALSRVEAILNHSSDAILLTQPDGTIQQVNYAFTQMFDLSSDEVYGLAFTTCIDPAYGAALASKVKTVVEQAKSERIELVARLRNGKTFDADLMLSPLLGAQGQVTNLVCSLRDISLRKQLERDLGASLMQERTRNEIRSRFIARISHEFRTPLATIRAASELLTRYYDRMTLEQQAAKLEQVIDGVDRITEILNNLLAADGEMAGYDKARPVPINLETLAREQIARVCEEDKNQHPIAFSCEGSCGWVILDPELTGQIISKLLLNAVRYSPLGSTVELALSCQSASTVISVRDNGIGIPSEDYPHLFEAFHRARNVQDIDGAGLGLAVVRRAVEMQGGSITFESQLGKGSVFTVIIPGASEREPK